MLVSEANLSIVIAKMNEVEKRRLGAKTREIAVAKQAHRELVIGGAVLLVINTKIRRLWGKIQKHRAYK